MQASHPGIQNMTNHLQTYTALQCLLFFQTLAAHRPESNAFGNVAESLKNSSLFSQGIQAGQDRLINAEALRGLYDRTIDTLSGSNSTENPQMANGTSGEHDEKTAGTIAPSLKAAQIIPALYEDYKRRIVDDIRAEERNFDRLSEELKSLQATDARKASTDVGRQDAANSQSQQSQKVATPHQQNTLKKVTEQQTVAQENKASSEEKPQSQPTPHPRRANASIDLIINHDEPDDDKFGRPSTSGSANAGPTPPFPNRDLPYAPPSWQQQPAAARHAGSSPVHHDRRSSQDMRQAPSPRTGRPGSHRGPHSPTAPVILPPPPGMNPPPFPPTSPYSPNADSSAASAYRSHAAPYASHGYPPHDPYASHRYPEQYPTQYAQRDVRRTSASGQPMYRAGQQPSYQPHSPGYPPMMQNQQPQRGGMMLPPFQLASQASTPSQPPQPSHPYPPQSAPPQRSAAVPDRLRQQNETAFSTPTRTTAAPARATPLSAPHTAFLRQGVALSPGSTTAWRLSSRTQPRERPPPRSISPPSDREVTPVPSKGTGAGRGRRGRPPKGTSATSRAAVQERSQSVSSHVSESVAPPRGNKVGRRIKNEPATTPVSSSFDARDTDDTSPRGRPSKRKRADSAVDHTSLNAEVVSTPVVLQPSNTVVAYRNFVRMAQPVMDIITSHKLASIFAEPVRERQAEGYRDIIKRPQDLKSIRTAISAGSRAVTAAVDAQQGSPGGTNSNVVVLPIGEALVPPKGIVNAAQLEQEIMRMFANAVMFNPGDEEIVQDSREMFDSVEQALQQWRDVERPEEAEEGPKDEEDGGAAKRRRV